MAQSIYPIKSISSSNYYAFRHNNFTKVIYFRNYVDAQKFASFLSLTKCKKPLYEYEQPKNISIYRDYFEIEKQDKDWLNFTLALNNLGYHECKIMDDLLYCIDTGIFDIHSDVKNEYITDKLTSIIQI